MDVLEKVNEAFVDAQGRPLQVHCSSRIAPLAVHSSGAKQLPPGAQRTAVSRPSLCIRLAQSSSLPERGAPPYLEDRRYFSSIDVDIGSSHQSGTDARSFMACEAMALLQIASSWNSAGHGTRC